MEMARKLLCFIAIILLFLTVAESKKKKKPPKETSETTLFNFLRLFLFRLIYGFASMIGAEEGVSDFMGGILVPPGVDNKDYKDYYIDGGDELDY